jgi:hypothetical protein
LSRKYSPIDAAVYGARYCIGAGSDADADDDRVLHAPAVLELLHTCATVDCFWPMAT